MIRSAHSLALSLSLSLSLSHALSHSYTHTHTHTHTHMHTQPLKYTFHTLTFLPYSEQTAFTLADAPLLQGNIFQSQSSTEHHLLWRHYLTSAAVKTYFPLCKWTILTLQHKFQCLKFSFSNLRVKCHYIFLGLGPLINPLSIPRCHTNECAALEE